MDTTMVAVDWLIPQLFHIRGSVRIVPSLLGEISGDRGEPDPRVRTAVARARASRQSYLDAIVALCAARLFMVVMTPSTTITPLGETPQEASGVSPAVDELGAVLLTHPDGTTALLCFTGLDAVQAWDARARPVAGTLDNLAATVREAGADVLLIDVAGPVPMTIGPDLIESLAAGRRLVRLDDGGFGWMTTG
jgi:hypothetical protein